ncbi:MAG TPA: hypothetical protein VGM41_16955 [Chitinophagaceae bacterium]|jgi:predicted membrane-bound spermidine synthase
MKKNYLAAIGAIAFLAIACKKSGDYKFASITGRWYYTNSITDTARGGQWGTPVTAYDANYAANLADSLQFTATDTVYYTYAGVTTWSNYFIGGNHLVLVGGGASDTLSIRDLTSTSLQIGTQNASISYWANFTRY